MVNNCIFKLFQTIFLFFVCVQACSFNYQNQILFVEDASILSKKNDSNWLEGIFPSMNNCTPNDLYFEKEFNRSFKSFLENKGYYPYEIDEYFAKYKIRETFFGFDAVEISMPSNTYSLYMVVVRGEAKKLRKAIQNKVSYKLPIYIRSQKIRSQSATAHLVADGVNQSIFVCFTSDEGG